MRLEICTGCHAATGSEETFNAWVNELEARLGVGYFGGRGRGVEVEFVPCLSHCGQGFSVAVEDDVIVLDAPEDFTALLSRVRRVAEMEAAT